MENLEIDIQIDSLENDIPPEDELIEWTKAGLLQREAEITIRIVDKEESSLLNQTYRKKEGPTNVLSFPFVTPDEILHGDIVLCAPIVNKEAKEQNKQVRHHWAHLTIHGMLHLQGYDHVKDEDAKAMEHQEIVILSKLGIPNPYE